MSDAASSRALGAAGSAGGLTRARPALKQVQQAALAGEPVVTSVIFGARTVAQLDENLGDNLGPRLSAGALGRGRVATRLSYSCCGKSRRPCTIGPAISWGKKLRNRAKSSALGLAVRPLDKST